MRWIPFVLLACSRPQTAPPTASHDPVEPPPTSSAITEPVVLELFTSEG